MTEYHFVVKAVLNEDGSCDWAVEEGTYDILYDGNVYEDGAWRTITEEEEMAVEEGIITDLVRRLKN